MARCLHRGPYEDVAAVGTVLFASSTSLAATLTGSGANIGMLTIQRSAGMAARDATEADLADGEAWTGWHRIEKDLWPPADARV
mgnify:CR=1 FL=1